jgi:predicted unusual protein kinase regulating ubiquinone biosynthesis (AarF/ABC1/UbiB family)
MVYKELCTRRILVSEWMDGKKLSECPPDEIAKVTAVAQEAFLTQLFGLGFFHGECWFSMQNASSTYSCT